MRLALLLLVGLATGCSVLRPSPAPPVRAAQTPADSATGARRASPAGEPAPRPYAQVIPPGATTREGLFRTHQVGGKLYYEIPPAELGREMLLVTQIAKNTLGEGYGGEAVNNQILAWERRGSRILLRGVSYEITADSALPIHRAVEAANYRPVIAAFDIEAFGPDSAAVIEVTRLFTAGPPEFGLGRQMRGSPDRERSFVERVAAFPTNVEVEATHTYNITPERRPGLPGTPQVPPRSASVLVHWSMVKLPAEPMRPRLHDNRIGFFSVRKQDFGTGDHGVSRPRYITRWRLECPPGESVPCEPARPIEYYIDPATPEQWRPWIRKGVEDWQRAFEEAGFRRAVVARDAPSPEEDPDWSPEDARYSVIRWLPSTVQNAQGPHVHDPRTGEILEADVRLYHNILNLLNDWYFVQVGPLDERARRMPFPDSLMGRLLQHVVAHEVGHTLGLPHNQKASATYAADSIRNPDFLRRMGHTPTLMDYSRYNYVAQPEDGVPPELLVPDIGPYDRFAIRWGYRPIEGARSPEAERFVLDGWAREQDDKPYLRFSTEDTWGSDPGDHTEAVGDADPVGSTRLGLLNLRRAVPMLIPAVEQPGEDYAKLKELYGRLVNQWATELRHVVVLVGGVESQEKRWGQEGVRFTPVPRARQAEAVRFLNEAAFQTPHFLLDPEILRRIEVQGALDRIGRAQYQVLAALLHDPRMRRLVEFEALAERPGAAYPLAEMLEELRRGVWSELSAGSVAIDPFRRNLQRDYLRTVGAKLGGEPPQAPGGTIGETRVLLRGELRALDDAARRAIPRAADRVTRLHLEDARAQIEQILSPGR